MTLSQLYVRFVCARAESDHAYTEFVETGLFSVELLTTKTEEIYAEAQYKAAKEAEKKI